MLASGRSTAAEGMNLPARVSKWLLSAALALFGTTAWAGPRASIRLSYDRDARATSCPDERQMRDLVAARLGYDPFTQAAEQSIAISIRREGGGLRADVEIRDRDGQVTGSRRLDSTRSDCG